MKQLTVTDFAELFGCAESAIPATGRALIAQTDWSYEPLAGADRDAIVLDLIRRGDAGQISRVIPGDKSRWNKGWGENLDELRRSGSLDALVPRYIRSNQPVRLHGDLCRTRESAFELRWYEIFRDWLLRHFFVGFDHVYEFGCGSGYNVATLAQLYPQAEVTGLDWAEPSVEICERLRTEHGLRARGRQFDFFNPDTSMQMPPNSAVLTIGALEQTGTRFEPFLNYLVAQRPALVVNVEPIVEWYEDSSLVDYTAVRLHRMRDFWQGFPGWLAGQEAAGTVEVLKRKRSWFGSLVLEGYSQTVWRPR